MELDKIKVTDEMIKDAIKYGRIGVLTLQQTIEDLALALQAERAKTKLWDGAPDKAKAMIFHYYDNDGAYLETKYNTRELPKTRADELAEECAREIESDEGMIPVTSKAIKATILKAQAEWEAGR